MSSPSVKVVIPFRDRGIDPRRGANLEVVLAWWWAHDFEPVVQSDGLEGDAQFNRHRAYNRAVAAFPETDVFVFTEADMIIHPSQIMSAVRLANRRLGLVVPFTEYRYMSDHTTGLIRDGFHDLSPDSLAQWWGHPAHHPNSVFGFEPEFTMTNGESIGAVNVASKQTLDLTGGFTEATFGNWYDDNITEEGFAFLTGNRTQWISGPAVHMYHLPGHKGDHEGDHLTDEDRQATEHNKALLDMMRQSIQRCDLNAVRGLMKTRNLTGAQR